MKELLATIMSIPHVDTNVKVRAGFLHSRLFGGFGYDIWNLFR